MDSDRNDKGNLTDMAFFRQEAARLRNQFNAKIDRILERIRDRKLKDIKEKIQK